MENVTVAKKRNSNGRQFGFVRYSKVKDVTKLLKAINNVSFGNFRIWAKVASFDRASDGREGKRPNVGGREDGRSDDVRKEGEKILRGSRREVEGDGFRVGEVDISVGVKQGQLVQTEREKAKDNVHGVLKDKLVRSYSSSKEDVSWAQTGVVATVINGESIPLVQQRIEDAGFSQLDIVPLGADKVFIRSLSREDVIVGI
ncbi:sulfate transporter [Trifolium medium]|uniref:Sulfate transporter n=1 Tax=Trifolium medium TaxID=97028 RepID=A0A392MQ17_9FABA|nr:sulfate transporter [Trifolium medium]